MTGAGDFVMIRDSRPFDGESVEVAFTVDGPVVRATFMHEGDRSRRWRFDDSSWVFVADKHVWRRLRLFTAWRDPRRPVDALLDYWQSFERETYLEVVKRDGLDAVAAWEWAEMTNTLSGWATSVNDAAKMTSSVLGRHVVEVTRETVRVALAKWLGLVEA